VAGKSGLVPDNRELRRAGPSYTVDTLTEIRADVGERPVCLILGVDAFAGLPRWHRWQELPELAHIVVVHRPGHALDVPGAAGELLAARRAVGPGELATTPAGRIWRQPVTPLGIAATAIRATVAAGGDPAYLVPDVVRDLILTTGCYASAAGDVPTGAGAARP
jgi:nicotinate-nucleotide adenylyltransferase